MTAPTTQQKLNPQSVITALSGVPNALRKNSSDPEFAISYAFILYLARNGILPKSWEKLYKSKKSQRRYNKLLAKKPEYLILVGKLRFSNKSTEELVLSYRKNFIYAQNFGAQFNPDDEAKDYKRSGEQIRLEREQKALELFDKRQQEAVNQSITRYKEGLKNAPKKKSNTVSPITSRVSIRATNNIRNTGSWNQFNPSPLDQLRIRALNTISSGIQTSKHMLEGAKTGLLWSLPAIALNPAIALPAMGVGTLLGSVSSMAKEGSTAIDLQTFQQNSLLNNNRRLSAAAKLKIRLALNNPANWGLNLNQIPDPAVRNYIQQEGLLTRGRIDPDKVTKKFKTTRNIKNVLNSSRIGGTSFILTTLLTGNPLAALAVGGTVSTLKLLNDHGKDKENQKHSKAYFNMQQKPSFKASLANKGGSGIFSGGSSHVKNLTESAKKEWEKVPALAKGAIAVSKNVTSSLQMPEATKTIESIAIKWNRLPTILKFAPILLPLVYAIAGPVLGYSVVGAKLLTAFGLGVGATGIGILSDQDQKMYDKRFNKRFKKDRRRTDLGTTVSMVSRKLDKFLGWLTPSFEHLGKIFGGLGLFFFAKSVWDLISHGLNKFTDYAKVATLVVTFILSFSMFKEIYDDLALESPKPQTTEQIQAMYQKYTGNQSVFAQLPTEKSIVSDCTIQKNITHSKIQVTDLITTQTEEESTLHLKGRDNNTLFIYKNLQSLTNTIQIGDFIDTQEDIRCT